MYISIGIIYSVKKLKQCKPGGCAQRATTMQALANGPKHSFQSLPHKERTLQSGASYMHHAPTTPPSRRPVSLLCVSDRQPWFHSVWVSTHGLASEPPCWGVVSLGGPVLAAGPDAWFADPPRCGPQVHNMLPDQPAALYRTHVVKGAALLLFVSTTSLLRRLSECVTWTRLRV